MNLDMRIADGSQFTVPGQCHANSNWFGTKIEEFPEHYLIEVPSIFEDVRLIRRENAQPVTRIQLYAQAPLINTNLEITLKRAMEETLDRQRFNPNDGITAYRDILVETMILYQIGEQTTKSKQGRRALNRHVLPILQQRITAVRSRLQEVIVQECAGLPVTSYMQNVIILFAQEIENTTDPFASWSKLDTTTYLARAIIYENNRRSGTRSDSNIDKIRDYCRGLEGLTRKAREKTLETFRTPEASIPEPDAPASGK